MRIAMVDCAFVDLLRTLGNREIVPLFSASFDEFAHCVLPPHSCAGAGLKNPSPILRLDGRAANPSAFGRSYARPDNQTSQFMLNVTDLVTISVGQRLALRTRYAFLPGGQMHKFQQDLRFGFRQMAKAPGFAMATILTLALGIGAMIVRRGMVLAGIGLITGVCVSLLATRLLRELLFGVQPLDAPTFLAVSAILLLVCLLASSGPAYRAASLDPVKTLRDQ